MSALEAQFGGDAVRKSVIVTATEAPVLGPVDVQNYVNLGIYVSNVGGGSADSITSVAIETAPTPDGPWVVVTDALAGALANDATAFKLISATAMKFVRLQAKCGAGDDTTADFWLCASRYGK